MEKPPKKTREERVADIRSFLKRILGSEREEALEAWRKKQESWMKKFIEAVKGNKLK
jgi:hypothetical protein